MPPKGSTKASGGGVTKKGKKKADPKPPRPKVLEREAKKQAVKDKKADKKAKAEADYEAGVREKPMTQKEREREKAKNLKQDRQLKEDSYASGDD